MGALLLWLIPVWTQRVAQTVQDRPLPSLGWGLGIMVSVGVLAIVIALVTFLVAGVLSIILGGLAGWLLVVGLLADAVLIAGFLLMMSYVPQVIVSLLVGERFLQAIQPSQNVQRMVPLMIGLLMFVILTAIPALGGLIEFVVILLGLGALWIWGRPLVKPMVDRPLVTT